MQLNFRHLIRFYKVISLFVLIVIFSLNDLCYGKQKSNKINKSSK